YFTYFLNNGIAICIVILYYKIVVGIKIPNTIIVFRAEHIVVGSAGTHSMTIFHSSICSYFRYDKSVIISFKDIVIVVIGIMNRLGFGIEKGIHVVVHLNGLCHF